MNTFAKVVRGDGYEHGASFDEVAALTEKMVARWGKPGTLSLPLFAASRIGDPEFARWVNRYERQCNSPGTLRRLMHMSMAMDVRELLPRVRCPVLLMHRRGDPTIAIEHGRYLAAHLSDVRFHELDGVDHWPWEGAFEDVLALVRAFFTECLEREAAS